MRNEKRLTRQYVKSDIRYISYTLLSVIVISVYAGISSKGTRLNFTGIKNIHFRDLICLRTLCLENV